MRRRLFLIVVAGAGLAALPARAATPSYSMRSSADCVRPAEQLAECSGSHWTTRTGGFGIDLTMRSPLGGTGPGWGRRTGEISITRTIPFTPDRRILSYRVQIQKAFVGPIDTTLAHRAHIWQLVRVEHTCRCVRAGEIDWMGPLITTQTGDGWRNSITNQGTGGYVGGLMDGWPAGSIRVTITFRLSIYLGAYADWQEPVPDTPLTPGFGGVRAILKGYTRFITTLDRWP